MSDQLFAGEFSNDVGEQLAAERKYGTEAFVYLVAIGTATLGCLPDLIMRRGMPLFSRGHS
jgi:hypothetical protein